MPTVTPVDYDPFGEAPRSPRSVAPVDYDPFAEPAAPQEAAKPPRQFGYINDYNEMRREAQDAMAAGAKKVVEGEGIGQKALGAGQAALGGISYVASPINAALRTVVGNPLEHLTGAPRDYTEFAAGLAVPGIGLTRAGPAAKAATKAPTVAELKASYVAAKEAPEVAAVQIKPDSIARVADETVAVLNKEWLDPELAPKTFRILNKLMEAPPEGGLTTMANMDSARRRLGDLIGSGGEEAAAAKIVKDKLDDWMMKKASPEDAFSGDISAAQKIMQEGRADYTAAKVGEAFDKRINKAEARANTTYSGLNLQNQIRQKAEQFLDSPDSRALNPTERKLVESVRDGNLSQNTLRYVGKLLGGGGGLGAFTTGALGGIATSGPGVLLPVVGYATTKLASHLTMKQAERVSEALRSRSPLGKQLNASMASWGKYAKIAEERPLTPRIASMLGIQSRNLSNNLKDAGITISPEDLVRGVVEPSTEISPQE